MSNKISGGFYRMVHFLVRLGLLGQFILIGLIEIVGHAIICACEKDFSLTNCWHLIGWVLFTVVFSTIKLIQSNATGELR